jgi:uncharacterized membrane protein YdbT with pleckstrin-like domain
MAHVVAYSVVLAAIGFIVALIWGLAFHIGVVLLVLVVLVATYLVGALGHSLAQDLKKG